MKSVIVILMIVFINNLEVFSTEIDFQMRRPLGSYQSIAKTGERTFIVCGDGGKILKTADE